ncbi:MAG: hypothetical protein BWY51_00571 [Parcubacteria group bacterium ADurb.Bin316]|nr:MAG: hypothetical protein BWY51_00571 [Parcubacteria group bacterium ADurb.Bin316]HOZ55890.1 hypothetical protein [bacterium]
MATNNLPIFGTKVLIEIVRDILYFPLWWYSRGLIYLVTSLFSFLKNREKGLALFVWIKNIFKPMYAQTDWQGVLISIFMRIVEIIARSIIMLFWIIIALASFLIWILLPPLVIYEIIFQLI